MSAQNKRRANNINSRFSMMTSVSLMLFIILFLHSQTVNADAGHDGDSDGLFHNAEACDAVYEPFGAKAGTCDNMYACDTHRDCVLTNSESCDISGHSAADVVITHPDTDLTCSGAGCAYCQLAKDFDCDGAEDNSEVAASTNTTDPLDPPPATPAMSEDIDNDRVGKACDNCPSTANWDQANNFGTALGDACEDTDSDTVLDNIDNCPTISNPDQADFDADGTGNACDPDVDITGIAPGNAGDSCPGAADNSECNVRMCFPTFTGVPGDNDAPDIDGSVNHKPVAAGTALIDAGWKGAHLYTFGNGTDESVATIQAVKDGSHLYFSFEVKTDTSFHNDDLIILTLRPNNDSYSITDNGGVLPTYDTGLNQDIRIFIYPVCTSGADGAGACSVSDVPAGLDEPGLSLIKRNDDPRLIQVWRNSANNWQAGTITVPIGNSAADVINTKVRSHVEGTNNFWSVELKLPVAASGNWPAISNDFLMYFNIIDVDASGNVATASQHRWPEMGLNINHIITNVDTYAYPNYEWGKATRNNMAACTGVSIDRSGIGTKTNMSAVNPNPDNLGGDGDIVYQAGDHTLPGYVNNKNNRFYANVTNSGTGPAANVTARFRIADWGYNGGWVNATWRDIPGTPSNPTASQTVPATGNFEYTLDWVVDKTEIDQYLDPRTSDHSAHQCILVELDSGSNVNFIKKSDYRNMNFNSVASVFEQAAVLSAKGYGAPPKGMDKHEFILKVDSRMLRPQISKPDGHDKPPADNVDSRMKSAISVVATHDNQGVVDGRKGECDIKSTLRWATTGYHNSGKDMFINGNKYRVITPTGGFGYYITHTGCDEVDHWDMEFSGMNGAKLDKMKNGSYKVKLAENETIKVNTQVEAKEESWLKKWWKWLVVGVLALLSL